MKLAIDFDGVIINRQGFPRHEDILKDPPVEGALDAIKWLKKQSHEIYICTARDPWEWPTVASWLKHYKFPWLRITNIKENGTTIFLDDRAVRFTNWLDFTKLIG